jgi:hypothetical protein
MTELQLPPVGVRPPLPGGPAAPVDIQTTVDCDDAHAQAAFWAAALGWLVEDVHDLATAVLEAGYATREDVVEIEGRLAWRTITGIRHPDDVEGRPGTGRRVLFIAVPDRAPGKNTWHFDLNVGRDRIDEEVTRLRGLGATEQYRIDEPGAFHTTMADPEGNLFCVQ